MSRSTYYFEINKVDMVAERNQDIMHEINDIFVLNKRRYGVRRVHHELLNHGYKVNHKRVQRLMHEAGLMGKRPKEKYHSYKGEVGRIADNLINFNILFPIRFSSGRRDYLNPCYSRVCCPTHYHCCGCLGQGLVGYLCASSRKVVEFGFVGGFGFRCFV